jgi:hypothetical protein
MDQMGSRRSEQLPPKDLLSADRSQVHKKAPIVRGFFIAIFVRE